MENNKAFESKEHQSQSENEQQHTINNAQPSPEKKPIYKKWWFWVIVAIVVIAILGSVGGSNTDDQGSDDASPSENTANLGDYHVVISSCRLAKDYEGNSIVIVKYKFTNYSDESAAFWTTIDETVYQNNIGLNECYVASDSANYSSDNQMKEIKKGATIDVEVAYILNDTSTPIDVEVEELFGYTDNKVTKTFSIK